VVSADADPDFRQGNRSGQQAGSGFLFFALECLNIDTTFEPVWAGHWSAR
jgi:hypothetical protein